MLSVLLRYTDFDNLVGIFKLFLTTFPFWSYARLHCLHVLWTNILFFYYSKVEKHISLLKIILTKLEKYLWNKWSKNTTFIFIYKCTYLHRWYFLWTIHIIMSDCYLDAKWAIFQLHHGIWIRWCQLCTIDQHTELNFYGCSSLTKSSVGRHVTPLGHIILILNQSVFAFSPEFIIQWNLTNLTQQGTREMCRIVQDVGIHWFYFS